MKLLRARRGVTAVAAALAAAVVGAAGAAHAAPPADDPAGITVDPVDGLSADFFHGVDVSTVLSLEESGVVFRDAAGEPADLFAVLADHGVNSVRIRVWNDPFAASGQGYGGGNVDVDRAVAIGERATAEGMSVLVDFHYSDFWADPARQLSPKAWDGLSQADRVDALHGFTSDALQQFEDAGVDVAMVQIGNETNNAIAGYQRSTTAIDQPFADLLNAGASATRDVLPDALVAVHFTNPETPGRYVTYASGLDQFDVDYDVFASSYYPFWHGSLENLTDVLSHVADTYSKQVMVAETSWVRTLEDGDGHGNVISSAAVADDYPISVQGQAWQLRDVIEAVAAVGDAGIGVYYWEPAWLPVGPDWEANLPVWEEYGSGWATSAAYEYDPVHVGDWYGGSAWDNQSLFDWNGTPLESLRTFEYVYTGAVAPLAVVSVADVTLEVELGGEVTLPAEVEVLYNDRSTTLERVKWSKAVDWIRGAGTFEIPGTLKNGYEVVATVEVVAPNLVRNASFEDADMGDWTLTWPAARVVTADASDGDAAVTFWSGSAYQTSVSQTITGVPAGTYVLQATTQGTNSGDGDTRTLSATTSEGSWNAPLSFTLWNDFDTATVTGIVVGADGVVEVRADFDLSGNAWGVFDDVRLVDAAAAGGSDVDTSALEAALVAAEAVDRSAFTEKSLAKMDEDTAIARVVFAGSAATEEDVAKATVRLEKAVEKLKPIA